MKIAIYTHSVAPSIDGVCRRFTGILYELVKQGHEILLFTLEDDPQDIPATLKYVTLDHTTYNIYPDKKVAFSTFSNLSKIFTNLSQFQPDIVHITSDSFSVLFAIACLYLYLPLVASIHTDHFDLIASLYHKPQDYLFKMFILLLLTQKETLDALVYDSLGTTSKSFALKLQQLSLQYEITMN